MLLRIRFSTAVAVALVGLMGAALAWAPATHATSANDAQLVLKTGSYAGNNLFMGTTKLEVGARANASFGSNVDAPTGYHPRNLPASNILGFRANPTECNWDDAACLQVTQGDFFTPGYGPASPYESWALQVGPSGTSAFNTVQQTQISGAFVDPPDPGGPSAEWNADAPYDGIAIQFNYSIPNTSWVLNASVMLTNTTGATINDVYFLRGVDADNCAADPTTGRPPPPLCFGSTNNFPYPVEPTTQTFDTFDTVRSNGPEDGLAQVTATQTDGTYLSVQLVSQTAKAFRRLDYTWATSGNLANIYSGADANYASDVGNTVRDDHSIFMVAKVPSIAAGASVTLPVKYVLKGEELNVSKAGSGSGTVSSVPAAIDCGASCSSLLGLDSTVTLTAAPSGGSKFTGWGGACSGSTTTCTVTMSAARSVTASFDIPEQLSVTKSGSGSGSVTSSPAGIDCGETCAFDFVHGDEVTLTAAAGSGSQFAGWGGACPSAETNLSCAVTMSEAKSASATFEPVPVGKQPLSVSKTGWGRVVGSGIDCGTECVKDLPEGEKATLTAYPDWRAARHGWRLDSSSTCPGEGWTPAAGRSYTCRVTMDQARAAKAVFRRISNAFKVTSTRALGSTIATRVTVPGPGTLTQRARRASDGRAVKACNTTPRTAKLAGKATLLCRANAATHIARTKGPVRVRICTHYRPTNGTQRTICRHATLPASRPNYTG